ncbi:MAG: nucleotide sugar dehydrogenase [Desulfobacterales bacterium]|jgi:UDP-N-acetyl-D-galactosamine dehydrogenase|nr:nucleotide sugar dehydrogenase [Desulfobacterales bacterium]
MIRFEALLERREKVAVVGLGYVGLPLLVRLAEHFEVIGYDQKRARIEDLKAGVDRTLEVSGDTLRAVRVHFSDNSRDLADCRVIIVAVPTPIDSYRIPDLTPVESASATVGKHMPKGSCVVFESTVYPGVTEEVCVPLLERESGLRFGKDFTVGYSPERINPGDKVHTLDQVVKVVSGSDADTCELLARLYGKIVSAGIHRASSIKVAEAAKVIENTQRDLNIALMNELSMIFERLGIDTLEVLQAAGTKWNFLPFRPGLVGGHCIGVDPYYLTAKAESLGYHPEIILAGRRINDGMGKYVAERTVKMMIAAGKPVLGARIAILGITFKEDVPDLRNTKVVDIVRELKDFGTDVVVSDALADPEEARAHYGIELAPLEAASGVDAVILAVQHNAYLQLGISRLARLCRSDPPLFFDVKGCFRPEEAKRLNIVYRRL